MTVKQWLEINRKIDVYKIARSVIEETEDDMVKVNRDQLMRNEDSDGKSLGDYRSDSYARFKFNRGQSGAVDLFLKGDFQRSIYVEAKARQYFFNATDNKTSKLTVKYGEKIFGMQKGYHFEKLPKK